MVAKKLPTRPLAALFEGLFSYLKKVDDNRAMLELSRLEHEYREMRDLRADSLEREKIVLRREEIVIEAETRLSSERIWAAVEHARIKAQLKIDLVRVKTEESPRKLGKLA